MKKTFKIYQALSIGGLFLLCFLFAGKVKAESDCGPTIMGPYPDSITAQLLSKDSTNDTVTQGDNFALYLSNHYDFSVTYNISVLKDGTKNVLQNNGGLGKSGTKTDAESVPIISNKFDVGNYKVEAVFHHQSPTCILKTITFDIKIIGNGDTSAATTTNADTNTSEVVVLSDNALGFKETDVIVKSSDRNIKAGEIFRATITNKASFEIKYKIYVDDLATGNWAMKGEGTIPAGLSIGTWATITSTGKHTVKIDLFDAASNSSLLSHEFPVTVLSSNNAKVSEDPSDGGSVAFSKYSSGPPEHSDSTNGKVNPSLGALLKDIFNGGDDAAEANLDSVNLLIKRVLDYAFDFAGIVAFVMVLWAARMFLNSNGSDETAAMGKKTLIWALVGLCVILVSKGLLFWIYMHLS